MRTDSSNEELYILAADGSGAPRRLPGTGGPPGSWSKDGVLSFLRNGDIWTVNVDGSAEPKPFRVTRETELFPVFSPDGKWLAYTSNEAGTSDLYVRPFPGGEPAYRISTGGAMQPLWSPDGRHLFWANLLPATPARQLWTMDVNPAGSGFTRGQPRQLFESDCLSGTTPLASIDINPNGNRFVGTRRVPGTPEPLTQIQIVQNWFEELKRLVPTP